MKTAESGEIPSGKVLLPRTPFWDGKSAPGTRACVTRLLTSDGLQDEIRMIDDKTMVGRTVFPAKTSWMINVSLQESLKGFLEPRRDEFSIYYFLTRA